MSAFLITLALLALGLVVLAYLYLRYRTDKLKHIVEEVNRKHGLSFEVTTTTMVGWASRLLFFDSAHRKLMFSLNGKISIHDFDYIRSWDLHWINESTQHGIRSRDVHFLIRTSDIQRPVIKIPMMTKSSGDVWLQRFDLILNG
jgi:hypothetical protein